MAKEYKLTRDRLKELEAELHFLKTIGKTEVAEQIKEARSFGDLSENSEYDEAMNEQARVFGRISEIEDIMSHAVVIDETTDAAEENRVGIGSTVKVRDIEMGENEVFAIVGSQEANPMENRISDDSPFGRALLGRLIGEIVEVEAPAGTIRVEILDVNR